MRSAMKWLQDGSGLGELDEAAVSLPGGGSNLAFAPWHGHCGVTFARHLLHYVSGT